MQKRWLRTFALVVMALGGVVMVAQAPSTPMDGEWVNVDPQTGSIVQLTLQGRMLHPYGRCHPDLCDWGNIKGNLTGDGLHYAGKLSDRVGTRWIEISLNADGMMEMRMETYYPDHRFGPDDSVETYILRRQSAP